MKDFFETFDLVPKTTNTVRLFLHDGGFFVVNASFMISPFLQHQDNYEKFNINILNLEEDDTNFSDFVSSQLINYASSSFPNFHEIKNEQIRVQIGIDISIGGSLPSIVKLNEAVNSVLKRLLLFKLDYRDGFVCLKV